MSIPTNVLIVNHIGQVKMLKQIYYAIRYGEWDWGWEMYEGKPMFKFFHFWHDGYWTGLHIYKFWVSVYH